jgi:hypothetical protein
MSSSAWPFGLKPAGCLHVIFDLVHPIDPAQSHEAMVIKKPTHQNANPHPARRDNTLKINDINATNVAAVDFSVGSEEMISLPMIIIFIKDNKMLITFNRYFL